MFFAKYGGVCLTVTHEITDLLRAMNRRTLKTMSFLVCVDTLIKLIELFFYIQNIHYYSLYC